jgi:hypothetical protein
MLDALIPLGFRALEAMFFIGGAGVRLDDTSVVDRDML